MSSELLLIQGDPGEGSLAPRLGVKGAPDLIQVEVPAMGWHRESAAPARWEPVKASLERAVAQVLARPGAHLHLQVNGPYTLGLLLGRRLEAYGALTVYQFNRFKEKEGPDAWVDWGPLGAAPAGDGPPVLRLSGVPAEPIPEVRDVALIVEITLNFAAQVKAALPALDLGAARQVCLSVVETGQTSLSPDRVADAERDLWAAIALLRERLPGARIHLFYSGPLALLIRAGRRIHVLGGGELWAYELSEGRYRPRIRFPDGAPLWSEAEYLEERLDPLRAAWRQDRLRLIFAGELGAALQELLDRLQRPVILLGEPGPEVLPAWPRFRLDEPEAAQALDSGVGAALLVSPESARRLGALAGGGALLFGFDDPQDRALADAVTAALGACNAEGPLILVGEAQPGQGSLKPLLVSADPAEVIRVLAG